MYCRNCGTQIPEGARFCGNCGNSVSSYRSGTSAGHAPYPKRRFLAAVFRILRGIVIGAVLFAILLVVCDKIDERRAREYEALRAAMRPTEPTLSLEEAALAVQLPDVPEHLRSVQALQSRGMGSCKELSGNVAVTVVFVEDAVSSWTQAEIDEFTGELNADIAELTQQAAQWDVALSITLQTSQSRLDYELEPEAAYSNLGPILSGAGFHMDGLSDTLKEAHNIAADPFVIAFNKAGRSHAAPHSNEDRVEACFLFGGSTAFKHELLHLFGAADFYYHGLMEFGAIDFLGDSIMVDSSTDCVDDLTAYLVGWTDQLTNEAETMVYLLGYIGNEELQEAHEQNGFTGFGSKKYDNGDCYTGNLVMGVPHGWGTMEYLNGDIYRGNFDNGLWNGEGFFAWINGDTYEGAFVDGKRTGDGLYIWSNGDTYQGSFLNGQLHGQGTLTKANGEIFSGKWEKNTFKG